MERIAFSQAEPGRMSSLMTATDVATLLGVPTSWIYEQSRRGRIPTVTLGRYRRYRRKAIDEWVGMLEANRPAGPVRSAGDSAD